MDVIFDIDGTLANAEHRLHFINDMAHWVSKNNSVPKPDWDSFLSDEQVANDTPIPQTWALLTELLDAHHRIVFVTGRPERQRRATFDWLNYRDCEHRSMAWSIWQRQTEYNGKARGPILFMRSDGDRRPSSQVKRGLLSRVRSVGFNPTLVFEDRADDTAMWRSEGLLCCQVAEGNY